MLCHGDAMHGTSNKFLSRWHFTFRHGPDSQRLQFSRKGWPKLWVFLAATSSSSLERPSSCCDRKNYQHQILADRPVMHWTGNKFSLEMKNSLLTVASTAGDFIFLRRMTETASLLEATSWSSAAGPQANAIEKMRCNMRQKRIFYVDISSAYSGRCWIPRWKKEDPFRYEVMTANASSRISTGQKFSKLQIL